MSKLKVALITCYKDPDYIRGKVILRALGKFDTYDTISVRNTHKSLPVRLLQVMYKLLKVRFQDNPDIYFLTFRGYELLWFTLLVAWGKPVIFDEFIQPVEVVTEHRSMKGNSLTSKLMGIMLFFAPIYYWLLKKCALIVTDTEVHANYSANISKIDRDKYVSLPVSADEEIFKPTRIKARKKSDPFAVFYYGNMVPLHGVQYVIEAAKKLHRQPLITFVIAGGDESVQRAVEEAQQEGAHIEYHKWIPFDKLPDFVANAHVCLGGPFGDTVQSHNVITGKTYQFLASGRPVILGKSKTTNAEFTDKSNALLTPQANATALAKTIVWAAANPEELKTITKNGFLLYKKHYSEAVIAQDLDQLLGSLKA